MSLFFFFLDNPSCSYLLIISLVFVFIMVLNEPRKFTFHSSSRKKTQFCRSLQSVVFLFDIRNKHRKRCMRKLTVHFAKLLLPQLVIQSLGTKTTFDVPGSNTFNTGIGVVSHITLTQWIAGMRRNSQELMRCCSAYRQGWLELQENVVVD